MTEAFAIAPAPARALILVAILAALMLGLLLLFARIGYASRAASFEVSDAGLRVRSVAYGRTIPAAALRGGEARIVSLEGDSPLRPNLRTNGIGMPGYSAGWFRLRNGERALLFVTERERVVYVPTADGYSVLLSARDPDGLLRALQQRTNE